MMDRVSNAASPTAPAEPGSPSTTPPAKPLVPVLAGETLATTQPSSLWRDTLGSVFRQRSAVVGMVVLSILILIAVFAINAAVLVAAVAGLALSPATVSSRINASEVAVLAVGVAGTSWASSACATACSSPATPSAAGWSSRERRGRRLAPRMGRSAHGSGPAPRLASGSDPVEEERHGLPVTFPRRRRAAAADLSQVPDARAGRGRDVPRVRLGPARGLPPGAYLAASMTDPARAVPM